MAHAQTSQFTTPYETLSRPQPIIRSRTSSQTRTRTLAQSSPSSTSPYIKTLPTTVSRSPPASHSHSRTTASHPVPFSSASASSSTPGLPIPHRHESLPAAPPQSHPAASERHKLHQHQNQSRGPGDRIDRKDQRHGGFNKDCHVLSEEQGGGPSLARPIPKQMQKDVQKRSISSPSVTNVANGVPSSSNSSERTRTTSGGTYQKTRTGANGHVQQPYPRMRTVSDGRVSAGSSSRDTNINVAGNLYAKAPAAPSLSTTTRAAAPQSRPHLNPQSGLPTLNQRDGSAAMASGSSTFFSGLPATTKTSGVTAEKSQSTSSIQRLPPPSMSEPSVAWTGSQSQPPSTSSPAVMASAPPANPPMPPATSASAAALFTTPTRRPSLASPLPPSPIVPASFPRHRAAPTPLNLGAAATPLPAATQNTSAMATPSPRPRTGSAGAHQSTSAGSSSWAPSPAQYATRPSSSSGTGHVRPGSSGGGSVSHPDSPSASAMMRRLLSKPAPVTSMFSSSGASGSESESKSRWANRGLGGSRTSGSESEGVGIVFGRRTGYSGSGLGRAATASAVLSSSTGANTPAGTSSRIQSGLRRKGSSGSGGSAGSARKSKRGILPDEGGGAIPDFEFDFSDVDFGSIGINSPGMDMRRKETYSKMEEKSSRDAKDSQDKGKEKEKRTRNVLRRRPSAPANMSSRSTFTSTSPSLTPTTPQSPLVVPPLPKSPPPPSPSERLPAIAPFSPLTLSPSLTPESRSPTADTTFLSSNAALLQPPVSPQPPLSQSRIPSSSKNIQRSKSAAAGPPSPRRETHAPHSRTASQSQPARRGAASPSPRRSAFMSMDASAPVALSPSSNIAVSISPRRSAFVMHPSSTADAAKASDVLCAPSACGPVPMKTLPSTSGRSGQVPVSPRTGTTPAASLVEAYKRQEAEKELVANEKQQTARERELRAVERQRAIMVEERERGVRGRRFSEDAKPSMNPKLASAGRPTTSSSIGRSRTVAVTHLSVQEQQEIRASLFSTHTNGSLDSILRVRTARSGSTDALNAGSGFAAIERLAGTTSAAQAEILGSGSTRKRLEPLTVSSTGALRKSDHFDLKPTSPRAFDGVERVPDKAAADRMIRDLNADAEEENRGSPEPYYTVFGGLGVGLGSGRGRAGAPGDVWADVHPSQYAAYWDVPGVFQAKEFGVREGRTAGKDKDKERPKESLGRTLSRKVSGHWRKQAGGGVVKDSPGKDEDGELPKRRLLRNKSSAAALSSRLQDHIGSDAGSEVETEQDHVSRQPQVVRAELKADSPSTPSPGGSINGHQANGGHERMDKGEKASGGRFWKLMKRISVGGLKDKFKEDSAPQPPPVPALPLDYRSRTFPSGRERALQEPMSPPASHSTMSTPARTIPRKAPPSSASVPVSPAISAGSIIHASSSSPMSSTDVASSKFSAHPYSPRSSTSSIGTHLHGNGSFKSDEAPPLPPLNTTTRHIISPSEVAVTVDQQGASTSGVQTKSMTGNSRARPTVSLPPHTQTFSQDWVIARTPSVELVALPLPPVRRPPASTIPSSSSPLVVGAGPSPKEESEEAREEEMDRAESPTIPSFSTTDAVNNFKPGRRSIGSSLKSAKSRESPVASYASPALLRSRSQPASPTSVHQPFSPPFVGPSPSSSSSSSLASLTPKLPPPRPTRSSQRPSPVSAVGPPSLPEILVENDPSTPRMHEEFSAWNREFSHPERKSESAIRDMPSALGNLRDLPSYTQQQHDMRAHHRRSSDALSSTSTARPRRRSSAYQLSLTLGLSSQKGTTAGSIISVSTSASAASVSPPPSATSTLTFGPVSPVAQGNEERQRKPLTEEEKAARWEDLLERSAQAGGTLHIAGGARVLASDRLKFGRKK